MERSLVGMKELRSIVNAVFCFLIFLVLWAGVSPGYARGSIHPPRFLRMEVEDLRHHREHVSMCVPYFFVGGALRFASLGRLHRELSYHFDEDISSEKLRNVLAELKDAPDGKNVELEQDSELMRFRKEGTSVVLDVSRKGTEPGEGESDPDHVTIRFPLRLLEATVSADRDFDVDGLVSELRKGNVGDLVDVQARDAHVKVWIE
jgi:hypothetical protein